MTPLCPESVKDQLEWYDADEHWKLEIETWMETIELQ